MAPAKPLLPLNPGTVALLSAPPKSGASSFAFALAHAVATGRTFPGLPDRDPAHSLFVSYDPLGPPLVPLTYARRFFIADDLPTLDIHHRPVEIARFGLARPALVVVDPLYAAIGRTDVNHRRPARRFMERMRALAEETGACLLLVHHTRAGDRAPGSSEELPRGAHATVLLRPAPTGFDLEIAAPEGRRTLGIGYGPAGTYLESET